jgi:hypothetical protein
MLMRSEAPTHAEDGVIMIESQTAKPEDAFQSLADAEEELRRLKFRKYVLNSIQVLAHLSLVRSFREGERGRKGWGGVGGPHAPHVVGLT